MADILSGGHGRSPPKLAMPPALWWHHKRKLRGRGKDTDRWGPAGGDSRRRCGRLEAGLVGRKFSSGLTKRSGRSGGLNDEVSPNQRED